NSDLTVRRALSFGTPATEMALDVAVDAQTGHVVLGGRYYGRPGPAIGPFPPLPAAATSDGFAGRLPPLD
ncbi:MAG: hypothetical protein KC620_15295, partial [Myxococcales bacterium]|nr:hypothetical protein [Myxococcales bacterium]